MQIVSGCFLAYGIFKIRQQATEDDTRQMNVPQLIYHVMVFGLYLAVNVTTLTIVAVYETSAVLVVPEKEVNIAATVANGVSFIAQLFLICILWPLTKVDPFDEDEQEEQEEVEAPVPVILETPDTISMDLEKDSDYRVWRQLVRPSMKSSRASLLNSTNKLQSVADASSLLFGQTIMTQPNSD